MREFSTDIQNRGWNSYYTSDSDRRAFIFYLIEIWHIMSDTFSTSMTNMQGMDQYMLLPISDDWVI